MLTKCNKWEVVKLNDTKMISECCKSAETPVGGSSLSSLVPKPSPHKGFTLEHSPRICAPPFLFGLGLVAGLGPETSLIPRLTWTMNVYTLGESGVIEKQKDNVLCVV